MRKTGKGSRPNHKGRIAKRETTLHRRVFTLWYESDENIQEATRKIAAEWAPRPGKPPAERTVAGWMVRYAWRARADQLNRIAESRAAAELTRKRKDAILKHERAGGLMFAKGVRYIANADPPNYVIAMDSVTKGAAMERQALGFADRAVTLLEKSDAELIREYAELARAMGIVSDDGDDAGGDEGAEDRTAPADIADDDQDSSAA